MTGFAGAAPATEDGLFGTAVMRYPDGTKAVASFKTGNGSGADKLIDGDRQTVMIGAEGTVEAPDKPVWVEITFGKPVENLRGVVTGNSDLFKNYYPKKAEFWLDTTGQGKFDTLGAKVNLGPGTAAAGQRLFEKPATKAYGLRFLVTEQNMAGNKRAFSMTELALLIDRPQGQAPVPEVRKVHVPEAGDRHIRMNIVYPKGAFKENGGPIINLKNPPFNAVGDGRTDDTSAFIRVLDFISNDLREGRAAKRDGLPWSVYLPKGTYLVSDTLVSQQDPGPGGFCYLRLIGQDRNDTVIRLKDKAPGFGDASRPKTLLPWEGKTPGQGNILWGNQARNFTIDTGSGNPGAIAMTFMGANASSMDNLTLRSGDGQGRIGLHFSWWSVQGHYCDITIEGFDVGIRGTDARETQPTLEYVTLSGQRQAGYEIGPHAASIRRLLYRGSAPAIVVNHPTSQTVLIDSRLEGKDAKSAAIMMTGDKKDAQVFFRNVAVTGYPASLDAFGQTVLKGDITEYVSGPVIRTFRDAPTQSMALPVEEVSLVPWESNPDNWTSPEDFKGTDVERVQAALHSGKPAIYFPKVYKMAKDSPALHVPTTVRQMDFMHAPSQWWCKFQIDEASRAPLWVENASRMPSFYLNAPRPIHLRFGRYGVYVNTDKPVSIHLENGAALTAAFDPLACPKNARLYARSINQESHEEKGLKPNFMVHGGLMWVLGFKSEQRQPSFLVDNGGFLEVLGGYQNFTYSGDTYPLVIVNQANASVVATTYMSRKYLDAIWETRDHWSVRVSNDEMPRRNKSGINYTMPLYTGYRPKALQDMRTKLAAEQDASGKH